MSRLAERIAKIEARQAAKPRSRTKPEIALREHIESMKAQHGADWEAVQRDELKRIDPALPAQWDSMVAHMEQRRQQNDALFQHISGGLKSMRDRYRRVNGWRDR